MAHLQNFPPQLMAESSDDLVAQVRDRYPERELEVDDFTDEVHFFYRDKNGKRRRFANMQASG